MIAWITAMGQWVIDNILLNALLVGLSIVIGLAIFLITIGLELIITIVDAWRKG